eukprot:752932-Hanusia_phi.AAC.5
MDNMGGHPTPGGGIGYHFKWGVGLESGVQTGLQAMEEEKKLMNGNKRKDAVGCLDGERDMGQEKVLSNILIQMIGGLHQDVHQQEQEQAEPVFRHDGNEGEQIRELRGFVRNLYIQSLERSFSGSSSHESSVSSLCFSGDLDDNCSFAEDLSSRWGSTDFCPNGDLMVESDLGNFDGGKVGWSHKHAPTIHLYC